jgi:hypothetical protein
MERSMAAMRSFDQGEGATADDLSGDDPEELEQV